MKIDFFEEFVVLAETGSFSKAAEHFPFSQAALTQHIQQMESLMGVKLFERSTRKVELSEYGRLVLPHAKKITRLKDEAVSVISQQMAYMNFDLTIGFYPTAARYNFVDRIHSFQKISPGISIRFRELLPEALMDSIKQGELDFAIMEEGESKPTGYDRLCLNTDRLAAVLPASHPLAGYSEVLLTQLAREQFFMLPEHTFVFRMAVASCKEKGFTPAVTYTSYDISNIIESVGRRAGVSLLMKSPATKFKTPDVAVVDLIPASYSSINLLYRRSKLTEHGQAFLDFMRTQIED